MNKITGFWLSPSYKCNNHCCWCYVGGFLAQAPEANLNEVKMYIDKMVGAGAKRCILVGGEPSIYPFIFDVIAYATSKGIEVRMMSNGRKLSSYDFVIELKKAGLKYCSISLEGFEEVHDKTTQVAGSFQESLQGILNCQKAGLQVNSITTISAINKDSLEDLLVCLQKINLRRAVFNMCSSQPSGYEGKSMAIIDLADYARIVERIGLKYKFVCFYALVPLCLFDQKKLKKLLKLGRIKTSCSLLGDVVAIDPEGFLLPCTHMAGLYYDNLNEPKSVEVLLAKKKKEKKILSTNAPSSKCVNCTLWNICHGGCNLIWFSRHAENCIPGLTLTNERR